MINAIRTSLHTVTACAKFGETFPFRFRKCLPEISFK